MSCLLVPCCESDSQSLWCRYPGGYTLLFIPYYSPVYTGQHWAVYNENNNFYGFDDGDITPGETVLHMRSLEPAKNSIEHLHNQNLAARIYCIVAHFALPDRGIYGGMHQQAAKLVHDACDTSSYAWTCTHRLRRLEDWRLSHQMTSYI